MTIPLPFEDSEKPYVLDANVFMAAWHDHYPPDLYPGFWECLERYSVEGRLISIDRVRSEIASPKELVAWTKKHWQGSFAVSGEQEVVRVFAEMQGWVQAESQYLPAAKDEFARTADGWLAAYAKVHGCVVVTNEAYDPNIRRRVPLPNLCKQYDVAYANTVDMLRGLGVRFDLRPSA